MGTVLSCEYSFPAILPSTTESILHSAVETGEFAAEFPFDFNDIVSLRLIPGRIG